jgi:hypothetical protein
MVVPAVLLAYAAMVAVLGPRWLQARRWSTRSPLLGIWLWQALTASVLVAAVLAGLTVAVGVMPFGSEAAELLHVCWLAIRERYSTPGGAAAASAGLLAAAAILARLAFCLARQMWGVHRCRRQHWQQMAVLAAPDAGRVVVMPDQRSLVYCLPGRGGIIVCTTAAQALLDVAQLRVVLAHERAHLHERHDLPLLGASTVRAAFPFVPAFRHAEAEIRQLVEMRADDVAVSDHPPRTLAAALVLLAEARVPTSALGAGGTSALGRFERLLAPRHRLGRRGILIAAASLVLTALPLLVAALPATVALILDYCPPPA